MKSNLYRATLLAATACVPVQYAAAAKLPVGVRSELLTDNERSGPCWSGKCLAGRPVSVLIFYPATKGSAGVHEATLSELGELASSKESPLRDDLHSRNRDLFDYTVKKYQLGDPAIARQRLEAYRNNVWVKAPSAHGHHPVVVYAGGANFMVQENVVLWRALAEAGYIVAAVPTVGVWETDFSADDAGLEALTRDMEVALAHVRLRPDIDPNRIAAIGFSYGGAAAVLLAMRHPEVRAVVGYDASFISKKYSQPLMRSPGFDAKLLKQPLLDIHARSDETTNGVLDQLTGSEKSTTVIDEADHIDFTGMPQIAFEVFGERKLPRRSLSVRAASEQMIVQRTLQFLSRVLKGS